MDRLDSVVLDLLSRMSFKPEGLAGSKAVLAKAALKGLPSSVPEVLICVRQWRATNDKAENWTISRPLTAMPDGKQSGLSLYYDARVVSEPPKSPFRKSS